MTMLSIYINETTEAGLRKISEEMQRDVHDLAECAVSEAVLNYFRSNPLEPKNNREVEGSTVQ